MKFKYKIEGLKELENSIRKLGDVPQKSVTKASKKGMNIVLKSARANAPVGETKNLRKGILLKGEKSKLKGKKVYQITMDKNMNDVFQKQTKTGMRRKEDSNGKVSYTSGGYYYPSSQEYGFVARNGKKINGRYFMRDALKNNTDKVANKIIDVMSKEIDKAMKG